jgi:hypothetical protein
MKKKGVRFFVLGLITLLLCLGVFRFFGKWVPGVTSTYTAKNSEERRVFEIAHDTAIKLYGPNVIDNELPLTAKLVDDSIWIVEGTLPSGFLGGTVHVEISRSNLTVRKITHYK